MFSAHLWATDMPLLRAGFTGPRCFFYKYVAATGWERSPLSFWGKAARFHDRVEGILVCIFGSGSIQYQHGDHDKGKDVNWPRRMKDEETRT